MPTLNEIEGVRAVVPRIDRSVVDELIVSDGGSTDGTVEYCREHGAVVHLQRARGYGSSILEALRLASGEVVVEITADGSSLPEKIPELVARVQGGCDLVLASRYRDGARSEDDDAVTAFGNWLFTSFTNVLFRASLTDVLVGYRAYRRASLDRLGMDAPGLEWVQQSTVRFLKSVMRVCELGADEPRRIGGQRKMMPFRTGWRILMLTLREFRR